MSDIFREPRQDIFTPSLPESAEEYRRDIPVPAMPEQAKISLPAARRRKRLPDAVTEAALEGMAENNRRRAEFRERAAVSTGIELSVSQAGMLYDMQGRGFLSNDDLYKIAMARELSGYLREYGGQDFPADMILNNYDAMWQMVSGDRENRYTLPKSRYEAIRDSVQIAKNSVPLAALGHDLMNAMDRIATAGTEEERARFQREADGIQARRRELTSANTELGRGMPQDALTTIITSTIQSSPATGRSIAVGVAGAVGVGAIGAVLGTGAGGLGAGPGFVGGAKIGYGLFSSLASVHEMAGLLYGELIDAGVEPENARDFAMTFGTIDGIIEGGLGAVASAGVSGVRLIGGAVLTQEAQSKIAGIAAKNFFTRIAQTGAAQAIGKNIALSTAADLLKEAAGESFEEGLQFLSDQMALALADALQDAPVERNSWGSPEFWSGLKDNTIGGLAGGLGFGIAGLPLNTMGNVVETARETRRLKTLAAAIDEKEEWKAEAKNSPLTQKLTDEQLDLMYESQEGERKAYHERMQAEEERAAALRRERLYGAVSQRGEEARDAEGRLQAENSRSEESGGTITGMYAVGDTAAGGAFEETDEGTGETRRVSGTIAAISWEQRGGTLEVTGFGMSPNLQNNTALRSEILKSFATEMGQEIAWQGEAYAPGEVTASVRRFGFDDETSARAPAGTAQGAQAAPEARADIDAKASFRRQVAGARTSLRTDAEIDAVVDFYDTVGRKWFNTGFAGLMDRMAAEPGAFITQELDDAQIAEYYRSRGIEADAAALTDEQRQAAMTAIRGAAQTGLNGVTKAIYAAESADLSTFIHEGIHAFTNLAKAADPELYRSMMEAAGLEPGAETDEATVREAWEKLAHQAETYFKEGKAPGGALKELFDRLKEFLRDMVNALDGRKRLTPEIKALYDGLFADTEGSAGTVREGPQNTHAQKDTASAQGTRQEPAIPQPEANAGEATAPEAPGEMDLFSDEYDRIIRDENRPVEERSEAAVAKAGEAYVYALADSDPDSLFLTPAKERMANVEKLRNAPNIPLDGNAYQGKYELTKESMLDYLRSLQKETAQRPLKNNALPDDIRLGRTGVNKIIGYGLKRDVYNKLLAHIPEITEKAVFITDEKPNKPDAPYNKYRHLVTGIEMDGQPYTVHIVLGENEGIWYYDHIITEIEKGSLLTGLHVQSRSYQATSLKKKGSVSDRTSAYQRRATRQHSLSEIKDSTLLRILQAPKVENFTDDSTAFFQTIGEQGAAALDKDGEVTTRLDNLAVARQMEQGGRDAKAVRLATGWERGADGKWRYEIPDIDFYEPAITGDWKFLRDILPENSEDIDADTVDTRNMLGLAPINTEVHKALFTAYPELRDIRVRKTQSEYPGAAGAAFSPQDKTIELHDAPLDVVRSLLIHEIQHAIQEIEGFARGGSPQSDLSWSLADRMKTTPGQIYHRTAGEVEARNAQRRRGFDAQQRLETLLADTEDVAREDQIFFQDAVQRVAMPEPGTAEVVDIDPAEIAGEDGQPVDLKDTRALTDWIKKRYQGQEITISDDGLRLTLTRRGLEASAKKRGEEQRQMYPGLTGLLKAPYMMILKKGTQTTRRSKNRMSTMPRRG